MRYKVAKVVKYLASKYDTLYDIFWHKESSKNVCLLFEITLNFGQDCENNKHAKASFDVIEMCRPKRLFSSLQNASKWHTHCYPWGKRTAETMNLSPKGASKIANVLGFVERDYLFVSDAVRCHSSRKHSSDSNSIDETENYRVT